MGYENLTLSCFFSSGIATDNIYNVAESLKLDNISGHSKPHVFRITRAENKAVLQWKKWTTDTVQLKTCGRNELFPIEKNLELNKTC